MPPIVSAFHCMYLGREPFQMTLSKAQPKLLVDVTASTTTVLFAFIQFASKL